MGKKYDKNFKVMIVELLQFGHQVKDVSEDYGLNGLSNKFGTNFRLIY